MGLLALAALRDVMPDALAGELSFLSVIEEECTGNGTLAAGQRRGARRRRGAARAHRPRPAARRRGRAVDRDRDHRGSGPRRGGRPGGEPGALRARRSSARWPTSRTRSTARAGDPAFSEVARPYNVNVGTVTAGDWASSVPGRARLRVRVGFPRRWTPDEAFSRVRGRGARAAAADPWLADHPPAVRPVGLPRRGLPARPRPPARRPRWRGRTRRRTARRRRGGVLGSTTDARFYLNQFGRARAVPTARASRNIHAIDEAVDLASIVSGARTLARFIAAFFADRRPARGEPGHDRSDPARPSAKAVRRAAGAGHDADRGRAHRRAARHGHRARRVRARASGCPPSGSSPPCWRSAGPRVREALQRLQAAGYVTTRRGPRRRNVRPDRPGPRLRRDDPPHARPGLGRSSPRSSTSASWSSS